VWGLQRGGGGQNVGLWGGYQRLSGDKPRKKSEGLAGRDLSSRRKGWNGTQKNTSENHRNDQSPTKTSSYKKGVCPRNCPPYRPLSLKRGGFRAGEVSNIRPCWETNTLFPRPDVSTKGQLPKEGGGSDPEKVHLTQNTPGS